MNHPIRYIVSTAIACTLALAGCGGGGGGSGSSAGGPRVTLADVQAADPDRIVSTAEAAAGAQPGFGSVTQSTNQADGVTTDRASAEFADGRLRVTVARQGKSALTLDSAHAISDFGAGPVVDTVFGIPGAARTIQSWAALNVTGSAATISGLTATWAADDPTDYLAAGYWLHMTGSGFGGPSPNITGAEAGAFVDGPEISGPPESLPTSGTATYRGLAGGLYASEYGTDLVSEGVPSGTVEIGDFTGAATLTADFADNTISGCIGCEGNIQLSGIAVAPDGGTVTFSEVDTRARVHLGSLSIDPETGGFRGGGVTLTSPDTSYASTSGSWGGRFSNRPVASGEPRAVAGTFGGAATTSGGSTSVFVGAFGAGKRP